MSMKQYIEVDDRVKKESTNKDNKSSKKQDDRTTQLLKENGLSKNAKILME